MAAAASSSSAAAAIPPPQEKYDVFLSFRGEDTRDTFTSHLHAALLQKKIETYIDNNLEKGDEIGPALREAIEKSKLAVVIFSKDYASSTWCLDELAHILVRKEEHGQIVIPIFYHTDPSHVRKQEGSYALAFRELTERFKDNMDKVHNWRAALKEAANLSGFHYPTETGTEADFIKEVVKDILSKLKRESSRNLKGLVAIESRIEQIESLLCITDSSLDVCTVGIWGMGGIGKTTLAEAVFHGLTSNFESCCFLKNVREKSEQVDGRDNLEKTLVSDILKEKDSSISSTSDRERLKRTKVLIVFDDVSDSRQIERLSPDRLQYGPGSRIIITSRDRSTLLDSVKDDKIYELKGLTHVDALELFHSRASRDNIRRTEYTKLAKVVVNYAGGIPLALKILGSSFLHCKSKEHWEDKLDKLKLFPTEEIHNVLRLSYNGLGKNEKEIFLDIACFHKGGIKNDVKRILYIRGFKAVDGIEILIDRSLISISKWNCIEMHDLLQEMGQTIVREEEPIKRSRLFTVEDVYHVLKNKKGTAEVEAIFFYMRKIEEENLNRVDFKKMDNLRWLGVNHRSMSSGKACKLNVSLDLPNSLCYLRWNGYPWKSLPSDFSAENLVELYMPRGQVEQLWNEGQNLMNLKVIDLSFSKHLTEVPDLSRSLKIEHIDLYSCESLVEIPSYFQNLDKLTHLALRWCKNLKSIPEMPGNVEFLDLSHTGITGLPSSVWSHEKISSLDIQYCEDLEKLPSNSCKLKVSGTFCLSGCSSLAKFSELPRNISVLNLSDTAVKELDSSIEFLYGLKEIHLRNCSCLVSLSTNICKVKSLEKLDLFGCSKFKYIPEILEPMEHLEFLNLAGTAVKELHSSVKFLSGLKNIQLHSCSSLVSLPTSIYKLKSLKGLDLTCCSKFEYFPEILEPMEHLEFLYLNGTAVKELHSSIEFLCGLKNIQLKSCLSLVSLPTSICKLKSLEGLDLTGCFKFEYFPEILEPIEHLEFLYLNGTAVKELHSSIEFLSGLKNIQLNSCSSFVSLPTNIYKLKSLKDLDLSYCSKFKYFPEILEPMEHLEFLNLEGTAVKKLHSSVEFLNGLKKIQLRECSCLVSLPTSICKLKSLEELNFTGCSKFKYFPKILEPMEHLKFLYLHGRAVKELHSSIEFLCGLKEIQLKGSCLVSLPTSICKVKSLEKLDLTDCSKFEYFPEILEPMEHLEFLYLNGTAVKELHSSIEFLSGLKIIQLGSCSSLVSLPTSICKLKSLEGLDLTYCSKFEYFPEILEPMEHLEFLYLNGTAVKELHSSIEFLSGLKNIQLRSCSSLVSLPTSICKLKSLKGLDLTCCSKFEYFPEILEPTKHLEFLYLNGTSVKELHSSIEFLSGLKNIELKSCSSLVSLPTSICKLKSLKRLNLTGCSKFEYFPEILEPMEHLEFLYLNGTAVKELHSSIEFLSGLKNIELKSCSSLVSLPTSICKLKSLERLGLQDCERLQCLPELPALRYLVVEGCTSLETVSSSREKYQLFPVALDFSDCIELVPNAVNNIMADMQLRIMKAAIFGKIHPLFQVQHTKVSVVCPGDEIPKWFKHQNEGCSITIKLPPDWFGADFLGFAVSLVYDYSIGWGRFRTFNCKCSIRTRNGESHEIDYPSYSQFMGERQRGYCVVVWYSYCGFPPVEGPNLKYSTAFNKLGTRASFHFDVHDMLGASARCRGVKGCGICPLYGQRAEIIKLEGTTSTKKKRKSWMD